MINAEDKKYRIFFFTSISLALLFIFASFVYASREELQEVDHAIKGKGARWVAVETSVSKLSPKERRARLTAYKPVSMENQPSTVLGNLSGMAIPSSLDWRNYNSFYYVTPVRNQGSCGDCWAFATTAALESFTLITQDTPGVNLDLSEQTLVSCGKAGSCSGGYIDKASNYIVNVGLPLETCFPYTATNGSCSNACLVYQTNTYRISNWYWVATTHPTVDAIKNALNTYGPLVTTMDVYSDFFYYTTGIYTYVSGTYQGGHAILIIGYDDTQEYFLVKNSWGTGWGEAGYFKIGYSELTGAVQFGFYTIAYEQTQIPSTQYTLIVNIIGSGSFIKNPDKPTYNQGEQVTLTATANTGYDFSNWSGDASGTANPVTLTMNGNKTVTANFTQNQYTLTVGTNPVGSGSVVKNPEKPSYVYGEQVTLTATPNSGHTFLNWSGDINSTNSSVTLTVYGNKGLTANFSSITETVSSPNVLTGTINGVTGTGYSYSTSGSVSSLGHSVEYQFDWKGDGTDFSAWGSSTQSKIWSAAGTYNVRVRARCTIDTSVVSGWSNALAVHILNQADIQNLVTEYYNDMLDRAPEPGGAEWWVAEIERIANLGIDIKEGFQGLAKFFFDSEEYGLKGKDNGAFVADLYQTFLNRAPDPDGLNFSLNYLGQGLTRDMLIAQFAYSEEFKLYIESLFGSDTSRPENNLVNDLYRGFLNRFPDTGGFNGWVVMMRNAQCIGDQAVKDLTYQIALAFVESQEYALRSRSNQGYVEDLYNGILRRGADPAGFADWVTQLNSGTYTREQMLPLFTNSAEFQFRVTDVINAGCIP